MTPSQHTNQTAFTLSARHLLKQGKKSRNARGDDQYRGLDGQMCAIGVFFTDETYSEEYEGADCGTLLQGVEGQRVLYPANAIALRARMSLTDVDIDLLCALQNIHDQICADISLWKEKLTELAKAWNLEMP